jgi:hypothetical protein
MESASDPKTLMRCTYSRKTVANAVAICRAPLLSRAQYGSSEHLCPVPRYRERRPVDDRRPTSSERGYHSVRLQAPNALSQRTRHLRGKPWLHRWGARVHRGPDPPSLCDPAGQAPGTFPRGSWAAATRTRPSLLERHPGSGAPRVTERRGACAPLRAGTGLARPCKLENGSHRWGAGSGGPPCDRRRRRRFAGWSRGCHRPMQLRSSAWPKRERARPGRWPRAACLREQARCFEGWRHLGKTCRTLGIPLRMLSAGRVACVAENCIERRNRWPAGQWSGPRQAMSPGGGFTLHWPAVDSQSETGRTLTACKPLGPRSTSKSTLCPSCRLR